MERVTEAMGNRKRHVVPEASMEGTSGQAQDPQSRNPPRLLGIRDLEACLALDRTALNGLWTREQWMRELSDDRRIALGIDDTQQQLIALAAGWLVADELQITAVAVAPHQRRQGLGAQITEALIQRGAMAGAQEASLDVASTNQAARALYASLGFVTIGSRQKYYRDGSDALLQWLKIENGRVIRTEQTENPNTFRH